MPFSHDTELALAETAALVNTVELDGDTLVTLADLDDFLARHPSSGVIHRTHRGTRIRACSAAPTPQILDSKRSRRGGSSGQPDPRGGRCEALPVPTRCLGLAPTRHRPERPARRPHRGRRSDGLSRSDQGRRARPAADMCRRGLRGCAGRSFQEFLEALLRHRKLRQPDQRCRIPRTQTPAERMKPSRRAAVPPLR